MIINIRGTHGSGKSSVIVDLMKRYEALKYKEDERGKILSYRFMLPGRRTPWFILGSYKTACGGCDGIQPYTRIWPLLTEHAKIGHVLLEGAIVSSSYGTLGTQSEIYGDQFIFAFMDTPVEQCYTWIKKRREAKGQTKPFNPKNTKLKYDSVARSIIKIRDVYKRPLVMLDHKDATSQVIGMLYDAPDKPTEVLG